MRPVFVLTPLNETLVRTFATVQPSESILEYIRGTIAAVRTALEQEHAEVIDLTDGCRRECFFDLVHVNTCGDDLMAKRWQSGSTNTRRTESTDRCGSRTVRQNLRKDYSQFPSDENCDTRRYAHAVSPSGIESVRVRPKSEPDRVRGGSRSDRCADSGCHIRTAPFQAGLRPAFRVRLSGCCRASTLARAKSRRPLAGRIWSTCEALCRALDSHLNSPVIYCNFAEIDDGVYGNYANKTRVSFSYQVRRVNLGLMDLASTVQNLFVADLSSLQNMAGRKQIFSTATYTTAGFAYALDFWPRSPTRILDIIQCLRGRMHKAVILDLDNTLWGGVVGDDGLENIQIGDLGIGKAFSELQAWLKQLKQRGILLAVCSKNYDDVAREVFRKTSRTWSCGWMTLPYSWRTGKTRSTTSGIFSAFWALDSTAWCISTTARSNGPWSSRRFRR